jgi:O-antigen ligase
MTAASLSKPNATLPITKARLPKRGLDAFHFLIFIMLVGTQMSYLILNIGWLGHGRGSVLFSPEAILGFVACIPILVIHRAKGGHFMALFQNFAFLFLLAFCLWYSLGELLHLDRSSRFFIRFAAYPLFFASGFVVFTVLVSKPADFLGLVLVLVSVLWYGTLAYFIWTGAVAFDNLPGTNRRRLGLADGLASTEIAIYLGFHICYLLFTITTVDSKALKCLALSVVGINLVVFYLTFSVSAIIAYGLIGLQFTIFSGKLRRLITVCILGFTIIFAAGFVLVSDDFQNAVEDKYTHLSKGGGRSLIYGDLIHLGRTHPLFGIGNGRFVSMNSYAWDGGGLYPHQNLLGSLAEGGLPAMVFYALFILCVLYQGLVALLKGRSRYGSSLVLLALGIFSYQQLRGMVQDTIAFKEIYFWAGILSAGYYARNGTFNPLVALPPPDDRMIDSPSVSTSSTAHPQG